MKNLGQMMKQVQEMQAKMQDMQASLGEAELDGVSGGGLVKVVLNGHGEARGIPHGLVEIRNDTLAGDSGLDRWAAWLAPAARQAADTVLNTLEATS